MELHFEVGRAGVALVIRGLHFDLHIALAVDRQVSTAVDIDGIAILSHACTGAVLYQLCEFPQLVLCQGGHHTVDGGSLAWPVYLDLGFHQECTKMTSLFLI